MKEEKHRHDKENLLITLEFLPLHNQVILGLTKEEEIALVPEDFDMHRVPPDEIDARIAEYNRNKK